MANSKVNVAATSKIVLYLAGLSKMIIESTLIVRSVRNLTRNSQHVRNKKNRENTYQEKKKKKKQSHAQENIYVVQQFAYVHRVAEILLLLGKNTKCGYSFLVSQERQQQQNKP